MSLEAFTQALFEVETSVSGGLAGVATAALAISGVVLGGLLLWGFFKTLAYNKEIEENRRNDPEG